VRLDGPSHDVAIVARLLGDDDGHLGAVEQFLEVVPGFWRAVVRVAAAAENQGGDGDREAHAAPPMPVTMPDVLPRSADQVFRCSSLFAVHRRLLVQGRWARPPGMALAPVE